MKIIYDTELAVLARKSFEILKQSLIQLHNTQNNRITLLLSGGSSLDPLYNEIKYRHDEIEPAIWKKIKIGFADERIVPLNHPESNYNDLKKKLLNILIETNIILDSQIIPIDYTQSEVAKDYENKFGKSIDICLLGAGPDGHTASLFPDHASIKNNSDGVIEIYDSPKPPNRRISFSRKAIQNSNYIIMFITNENKRSTYKAFHNKELGIEKAPVKIIQNHIQSYLFTNLE